MKSRGRVKQTHLRYSKLQLHRGQRLGAAQHNRRDGDRRFGCTITGTGGDDALKGTRDRDIICGRGDDTFRGGAGKDVIRGGRGAKTG